MGLDMNVYHTNGVELTEENFEEHCADQWQDFYWRKANAIHGWFVDTVQGGKDECQLTEINWPDLLNLKSLCLAALKYPSDAANVLPVREGFFFGSYDYDEYYMEALWTTIAYIETMQGMKKENPQTRFFYKASW